jgi:hypothetical protein
MEEVTLTGAKVFPHIFYKRPLKTGNIETFRELVETIATNERRTENR